MYRASYRATTDRTLVDVDIQSRPSSDKSQPTLIDRNQDTWCSLLTSRLCLRCFKRKAMIHICTGNLMQLMLHDAQPACSTISLTTIPFLMTLLICSGRAHSLSSTSVSLFGGSTILTLLDLLVKTSVAILSLLR